MSLSFMAVYFSLGWLREVDVVAWGEGSGRGVDGGEGTGVFPVLRLRDVTTDHSAIFASYYWKLCCRWRI
jgi:hypothetical protein